MNDPFTEHVSEVTELERGDRIILAYRRGTFKGYYKLRSWPNVIEWLPDDSREVEVALWPSQGVKLSSFDDDPDDFKAWSLELAE